MFLCQPQDEMAAALKEQGEKLAEREEGLRVRPQSPLSLSPAQTSSSQRLLFSQTLFSLTLLIPVPQFTDYSSLSTLLILPRSPSFTLSSQHNFLHATLNVLLQAKFEFFEKERAEAEINLKEMMSTLQAQMAAAGAQ